MVHFACGDATSAKRLETFDVVADVASARARRFRGGVRGARTPLQVCKSRFGGYAWAGARQGAFAHTRFATSTASSSAFDALNTFGAIPGGARRAMHSEGGGRREVKSARKARAAARETVMAVSEEMFERGEHVQSTSCRSGRGSVRPDSDSRTSIRSKPSAPPPEARVGRCTPRWAGDAIQPLKRRESARKARAGARETVMPVELERLRRFN